MPEGSRKISVIIAPHGSSKSWTRVLPAPALIALALGVVALVVAFGFLVVQVLDLSARAREAGELRAENTALHRQARRIGELEAELARLQEFETRIRRWAGIDAGVVGPPGPAGGGRHRWDREEALLAEIPSLPPLGGWASRGYEPGPEGHPGIDLVHETGTPVLSSALGIVRFAGWDDMYGNLIILDHGNGFTTLYGHNEELLVSEGDLVGRGEAVARLGNTGRSSAPHLHFEVRLEDEPLDPEFLLART